MTELHLPHLLLLPAPLFPSTRTTLSAAYRDTLSNVLRRLKSSGTASQPKLIAALACPILTTHANPKLRALRWRKAQALLAGVYSIIAHICAQEGIESDVGAGPGSVDARLVLVDHDTSRKYWPEHDSFYPINSTTVLDLAAFASRIYPWETVFHPDSEEGYRLLSDFLKFQEGKQKLRQNQLVAVAGGVAFSVGSEASSEGVDRVNGFRTACLGGTFDHLHLGHKLLLHATALLLKLPDDTEGLPQCQLIVGISGDELLVKKQFAEELEPWIERAATVLDFLSTVLDIGGTLPSTGEMRKAEDGDEMHAFLRSGSILVRCVNLHDSFGPTTTEEALDVICVSAETRSGGQAINVKRGQNGWRPLEVFEIEVLDATGVHEVDTEVGEDDFASKISSTAIRKRNANARARY